MTRLHSLRILDRITVFAIAFTASTLSQAAAPLQPEGLSWNPSWAKFRPLEYVLTGVAGVASVGIYFCLKPPTQPHWTGGILFDDSARDALRVRSPNGLARVRSLSDLAALTSVALVVGVDSLVVPLARGKSDVALHHSTSFVVLVPQRHSLAGTPTHRQRPQVYRAPITRA